ncbi:hypothetical protein QBC42DRAFT_207955 [Cladorrhinum samala]|uniref:AAA+ ATPase domain-containing protein n=1 Tax=Cladorrhinum samala TaxID=585594 RepID=A0AAV9HFL8_9PEZI|nr:hypothetical protein QBC42DRAFT_207955 [Cladorrhinum samala]
MSSAMCEIENRWWENAREAHNRSLKNGRHSRRFIQPANSGEPLWQFSASDLLEHAVRAAKKFSGSRRSNTLKGKLHALCQQAVDQIRRHAVSIDVIIQQHAFITAPVWGTIRLIFQLLADKAEASEIAVKGIIEIVSKTDRWKKAAILFYTQPDIETAATELFVEILGFLTLAKKQLEVGSWTRFGEVIMRSKKEQFQASLGRLREAAEYLKLESESEFIHYTVPVLEEIRHNTQNLHKILGCEYRYQHLSEARFRILVRSPRARPDDYVSDTAETPFLGQGMHNPALSADDKKRGAEVACRRAMSKENWSAVQRWLQPALDKNQWGYIVPAPRTTQWATSQFNPSYYKWLEEGEHRLLLFEGPPGCGKSYVAHSLETTLKEKYNTSALITCSFSTREGPSKLSACILFWLLRKSRSNGAIAPIVAELAELALCHNLGPTEGNFGALWKIVIKAFQTLVVNENAKVFIVIDSLEQYDFKAAGSSIQSFFDLLNGLLSISKNTRIVVFTRPRAALATLSPATTLRVPLTADILASDIHIFSHKKFDDLGIPPCFKDMTMEKIRADAKGSFQWVNMVLEYMSEPGAESNYQERLHRCPPGLTQIYDKMLEQAYLAAPDNPESRRTFLDRRRLILSLVWAAYGVEPLTVTELARAAQLGPYNAEEWIVRYGEPLLTVEEDRVHLVHSSVAEFLTDETRLRAPPMSPENSGRGPQELVWFRPDEANSNLAFQCLHTLLDEQYASGGRIGQLLHHNFWKAVGVSEPHPEPQKRGVSLKYAARHWDYHLIAAADPPTSLLSLADRFLHVPNFVFWSEWSIDHLSGSMSRASTVLSSLKAWRASLPPEKSPFLNLTDYFARPYRSLSASYRDSADSDKVLQYLPLMRLGRFYVDTGSTELATPLRREVATGLTQVLGTQHPLTLQSRTDLAYSLVQQGCYGEANGEFSDIVEIDRTVLGSDSRELYRALNALGETELYLNLYDESAATQREVADGSARLAGQDSKLHLTGKLWIAYPLAQLGRLEEAEEILLDVFRKRREGFGEDDLFAASAGFSLGGVYRRMEGKAPEAVERLEDAYRARKGFGLKAIWGLDFAIELAIAYRDVGQADKAGVLLREIEEKSGLGPGIKGNLVKRFHQVMHLKALMLWDAGECDKAVTLLQGLLIQIERDQYDRAVLWIILDLAEMLRLRGGEGDDKMAEANFNHVLVDLKSGPGNASVSASASATTTAAAAATTMARSRGVMVRVNDHQEPDPPRLLRLAETALRLVRGQRFEELEKLFREERVDWFRREDLWLWWGGPAADTTWMKPPRDQHVAMTQSDERSAKTSRTSDVPGRPGFVSRFWSASTSRVSQATGSLRKDLVSRWQEKRPFSSSTATTGLSGLVRSIPRQKGRSKSQTRNPVVD